MPLVLQCHNKSRNTSLSHSDSANVKFGWSLQAKCSQVAHVAMSQQVTQRLAIYHAVILGVPIPATVHKPTSCKKLWFIPALLLWLDKWYSRSCIWGLLLFSCPYRVWTGVLYTSAFRLYQIHIRLSSAWLVLQQGPSVVASLRYVVQRRNTWENTRVEITWFKIDDHTSKTLRLTYQELKKVSAIKSKFWGDQRDWYLLMLL